MFLGLFKLEKEATEEIALSSKLNALVDSKEQTKITSKGLSKKAQNSHITIEAFQKVLTTKETTGGWNMNMQRIKRNTDVTITRQQRNSLSYLYIKRNVKPTGETYPLRNH